MNAARLLELQLIDSALDQLGHRRSRLPELAARAAAVQALNELERLITTADQSVADAVALINRTEHQASDLTVKRDRLDQQLKTVISPREAEALMHEIAHLNAQRGELDDHELAALEEQAAGEQQGDQLRALLAAAHEQVAAAEHALSMVTADLDREQAELTSGRAAAAADIGPDALAIYERARRQFAGVAVAQLDGLRCQGCHLDMSRGEADIIRAMPADELPECPQCGRFLVR